MSHSHAHIYHFYFDIQSALYIISERKHGDTSTYSQGMSGNNLAEDCSSCWAKRSTDTPEQWEVALMSTADTGLSAEMFHPGSKYNLQKNQQVRWSRNGSAVQVTYVAFHALLQWTFADASRICAQRAASSILLHVPPPARDSWFLIPWISSLGSAALSAMMCVCEQQVMWWCELQLKICQHKKHGLTFPKLQQGET